MVEQSGIPWSTGDSFRVVRGSRAAGIGVTGTVDVEQFDGTVAEIAVSVGKFGFRIGVKLRMERSGDDIEIVATGRAFDPIHTRGRVVVDTVHELRIQDADGEHDDLILRVDDDGTATLDADIPSVGRVQLLLEPV